ncbi:hypothetical protein F4680DRAFT_456172 [Xylaria scruposa]|nr:hypothetical protein F4680DRAFT_456172 [Xylaria scruposa]
MCFAMSLSHFWGQTPIIKTTKSNYETFKKSIELSFLSKTFQGAIDVTKALGEIQAAKIASIYRNAYLTLAATGAAGSSEGLFLLPGERVRELPGMKRAWMLQEQMLSLRLLHFTEDELLWECDSSQGIPNWYATMQSYIPRGLTYDRDRLPAISALSKLFSELSSLGTYYAGIWASEIVSRLMWQASQPGRRTHADGVFDSQPPTWSWASVESCRTQWQLLNDKHEPKSEAEVLDIACYPSTRDPKGMVSGGHVTLRSKLLALRIKWHSHIEAQSPPPGSEGYFVSVRDDTPWPKTTKWTPEDELEIPSGVPEFARFAIVIYPDVPLYAPSEGPKSGGRIYFLKMALVSVGSKEQQAYGLFLREVDPLSEVPVAAPDDLRNRRLFRRIGLGVIQDDDVGKDLESCPLEIITII